MPEDEVVDVVVAEGKYEDAVELRVALIDRFCRIDVFKSILGASVRMLFEGVCSVCCCCCFSRISGSGRGNIWKFF